MTPRTARDPRFRGSPRPGSHSATDITFIVSAGQRCSMRTSPAVGKVTGRLESHSGTHRFTTTREEREMGLFSSKGNDTRRVDGKPETAKDKKFFDLRESGYKGPIDHNGNKVEDLGQWIKDHS